MKTLNKSVTVYIPAHLREIVDELIHDLTKYAGGCTYDLTDGVSMNNLGRAVDEPVYRITAYYSEDDETTVDACAGLHTSVAQCVLHMLEEKEDSVLVARTAGSDSWALVYDQFDIPVLKRVTKPDATYSTDGEPTTVAIVPQQAPAPLRPSGEQTKPYTLVVESTGWCWWRNRVGDQMGPTFANPGQAYAYVDAGYLGQAMVGVS